MNIKEQIKQMSLEQKIGQMFMARQFRGPFGKETLKLVKEGKLGGIHIGPIHDPNQMARIQKMSPIPLPLLMASDMEWGYITNLPCAMALGAVGSEKMAYQWAKIAALEARSMGINFVFGPVLDIAMVPESLYVNLRSFGVDPNEIVRLGTAVVRGYQENGLIVSAKHYPGFGRSPVDSHIEMCVLNCTEREFKEKEIFVYQKIIEQVNLTGVMSGHILVPSIDKKRLATVSKKLVNCLRSIGYDGLIITDSLAMKGLKSQIKTESLFFEALRAGNDMILGDYSLSPELQYGYMLKAVKKGALTEKQIDKSVTRILTAKQYVMNNQSKEKVDFKKHKKFVLQLNRKAISKIQNSGRMEKLGNGEGTLFLITHEDIQIHFKGKVKLKKAETHLVKLLKKKFSKAKFIIIPIDPNAIEIEHTLDKCLKHKKIVVVAYALITSYKGTADLPKPFASLIGGLKERIKIFVLIGNPYAARALPSLPCFIFPYAEGYVDEAIVEVLAGELKPQGRLPISLEFRGY